jgi:hypothetical protein
MYKNQKVEEPLLLEGITHFLHVQGHLGYKQTMTKIYPACEGNTQSKLS